MSVQIDHYRDADEAAVLSLWNSALPLDPIDQNTFRRKVLLDPNFDSSSLLVAKSGSKFIGFGLCLVRHVPMEGVGMEEDIGWITAFAVHPSSRNKGVGGKLLETTLAHFAEAGRSTVQIAPYTPNYFVPGVDVELYADGIKFLEKHGFETISRPLSMDASLLKFSYSNSCLQREEELLNQGISIRFLQPTECSAFMAFMCSHMPGDWARQAREALIDATKEFTNFDRFIVAALNSNKNNGNHYVGYSQFEGEHFGPFGVLDCYQGKNIGTVLLGRALEAMRQQGSHNAWVLWTNDKTARLYERFGFTESRRFAIMEKKIIV